MARVAFFDVDQTLWADTSLLTFYRTFLDDTAGAAADAAWAGFIAAVEAKRACSSRDALNAWFFAEHLAGVKVETVARVAAVWWRRRVDRADFWVTAGMQALRRHAAAGDTIVLVTGSLREVVAPLVKHVGATAALVAPLEEIDGVYTGRMTGPPMIGAGKAAAVQGYLAAHGLRREDSWGYGDDETDVPFLEQTGYPAVVGRVDARMADVARARGWALVA